MKERGNGEEEARSGRASDSHDVCLFFFSPSFLSYPLESLVKIDFIVMSSQAIIPNRALVNYSRVSARCLLAELCKTCIRLWCN